MNKSIREGQTLDGLIHLGNIKKIVKGNKGERRENEWEISVRMTEHERLLTLGNKQGIVAVSYTHLTLPTTRLRCRSRWSPYH